MFYEIDDGLYVAEIGMGEPPEGGYAITEERYTALIESFRYCPICEPGYKARLKTDITWEIGRDEEQEIDDAEAFDIIFGGEG